MDPTHASPSKVKVEYTDPNGVFPKIADGLMSRLPLRNLNWHSQTRPLRSIESLYVDIVPANKPSHDSSLPSSQDDSGSSRSFDQVFPHKERRHQIPGLRRTPYLKIYILRCDDSETYKTSSRKLLREWIKSHGSAAQAKGPNNQENHDAFEWLIIYIAPVDGLSWPTKTSLSVVEKVKSDFNGSSKASIDRVAQIPCAFDIPGGNAEQAVSPGPSREQFLRDANRGWDDLLSKFKSLILSSFDSRVRQYEEDIKEKGSQRNIPGWNFCTFFVLKEGLARGFESVGLVDDALMGYDELSVELLSAIEAEQEKAALGIGASLFKDNTKDFSLQLDKATSGERAVESDISSLLVLDSDKKPYRELILANDVSVFEFQSYVFARQIAVLMRIASLSGTSQNPSKDGKTVADPTALAEICSRATSFIAASSRVIRKDLRSYLKLDATSDELIRRSRHDIVENFVASWSYSTAQQIINLAEDGVLSKELEIFSRSEHRALQPQLSQRNSQSSAPPTRTSSLQSHPQSSLAPVQSSSLNEESATARTVTSNPRRTALYRLATQRAELYLVCRRSLRGIGERLGWHVGWKDPLFSGTTETLDDISLDGSSEGGKQQLESINVPSNASFKASILGKSLVEATSSESSFHDAYEELSWLTHNLYRFSGDEKSLHAMVADIATLKFHLKDYAVAASYFHQLAPFYADQNWADLELAILDMYARCLKGLDKPEEYVRIGLKLLAKATISTYSHTYVQGNSPALPMYSLSPQPGDHLSSILYASKKLKDPCIVHLRNYFFKVKICQHIEHITDNDGFAMTVFLRHIIPEEFEALFKIRLTSATEGCNREIWLSSNNSLKIRPGEVKVRVTSNVLIPDKYLVDKLIMQCERVVFQHDFAPKEGPGRYGLRDSASLSNVSVPSEPIIVWPPEWSFKVAATATPDMHLDKPRAVLFILSSGDSYVDEAVLQVKPATAGLRMYTADAILAESGKSLMEKTPAGYIKLIAIPARTSVKIAIPFQLDSEFKQISLRSEVNYSTIQGNFTCGDTHNMSIVLPLGVNVQDIFKATELYSRFTVSCSTPVPLAVIGYEVHNTSDFDITTVGSNDNKAFVFLKQPLSMVYRIARKNNVKKEVINTKLSLSIQYQCLDEEIVAAMEQCLSWNLEKSKLQRFKPLLTSHMLRKLQEKLPRQDLELVGLLREIGLAPYSEFRWDKVLNAVPESDQANVISWLEDWHKNNEAITIPTNCTSAPIRKVTIPVDIPPMHIVHTATLRLLSPKDSFGIGDAVPTELTIWHTRRWSQCDAKAGDSLVFCYELDASPDSWLIGGRRRATYSAREDEEKKFSVLLLPQKSGKLMFPSLDITLINESKDLGERSLGHDSSPPRQWSCEVDYLSQGEAVLVMPNLRSTTVAMDLEGEQSWLVDAEGGSRQRAAASASPPPTATIPSSKPSTSSSIPLRTLIPSGRDRRQSDEESLVSSDDDHQEKGKHSRRSSDSAGSDFSFFSDTGDLAEQLADEEDPLRIDIRGSSEREWHNQANGHSSNRSKRVRYNSQDRQHRKTTHRGINKEAIYIPEPAPRMIGGIETLLACVMTRNRHEAQSRGLVGKPLLYFTSVFVSLGVFLFGYDQGVMSGIITGAYFRDFFNQPNRAEIGTMVAILEVGAFISSLCVGRVGDILGRKRTILYGSIVFFIGGALQTFANGMPMMLIGRILAGFGVGALSTIVPVYQSEISPPHNRGKLACIEFSGNIIGYAASVWVDYFCSYIDGQLAWRIPLSLQCVMGAMLGLGSFLIPESPRWLLDNDHDEEGIVVIANLYGGGDIHNDKARQEYREIKMGVLVQRQEGERSYSDMFKRYYKRVLIAMSAQALAQLNGINVISYYAPLVFEEAGWIGREAILMTGVNALTYLLATIPPWYVVDRWGRRKILLSGAIAMAIALSAISYFLFINIDATPTLVVILVMIYNAAFGASWGPIPWLYPPEILPLSIRAKGASLSTAANWAFNFLVGELTPVLQELIKWRLYLVHAFFCASSFIIVYFLYPETANVRLEDMDAIFGDATTAMPTPAQEAEVEALMSASRSPVPSLDIRRPGGFTADSAIPGLDINPPTVDSAATDGKNGKSGVRSSPAGERVGGWVARLLNRDRKDGRDAGDYRRVEQQDDGDDD